MARYSSRFIEKSISKSSSDKYIYMGKRELMRIIKSNHHQPPLFTSSFVGSTFSGSFSDNKTSIVYVSFLYSTNTSVSVRTRIAAVRFLEVRKFG